MNHGIDIGQLLADVAKVRIGKQEILKRLNYSESILNCVKEIINCHNDIKRIEEETETNWIEAEKLWKKVTEKSMLCKLLQ